MENYRKVLCMTVITALLIATGCATSGSSSQASTAPEDETWTLEEHLRRINGVQIMGSGDYAKVILRGSQGISSISRGMGEPEDKKDINLNDSDDRQPLFVVDGQKVGRNYPDVRDMFSPGEIASVKLLTDSQAAQYGGQGGNGVIVITTKAAEKTSDQ